MPRKDSGANTARGQQEAAMAAEGIENFELPKTLVTKIAKSPIPDNSKFQKETVLAYVKGCSVFINYLSATAQDVATQRSHKTISAADVLKALEIIEMGDLVPILQTDLEVYRTLHKGQPKAPRKSAAAKDKEASEATTTTPKGKGKEKEPASGSRSSARTRAKKQAAAAVEEEAAPPAPATEDVDMAEEDEDIAQFDEEEELLEGDELEGDEEEEEEEEGEEETLEANGMQVDESLALSGRDFDKEASHDHD